MKTLRRSVLPVFFLSLASVAGEPGPRRPSFLGSCEGGVGRTAYLVELYGTRDGKFAQVHRYRSRAGGDEWLEAEAGPVAFYDDYFEDAGTITHHLIDRGLSHEDSDEASLHVVYVAKGSKNVVPARIRFVDGSGRRLEIRGGCAIVDRALGR